MIYARGADRSGSVDSVARGLKFLRHKLFEALQYFALPSRLLLVVKHHQRPLLLGAVNLVLLSNTHGIHPLVSGRGERGEEWTINISKVLGG